MKIREILAQKGDTVKTVSRSATLGFISELVTGLGIASIVVVDAGRRPLGIVTDRLIIRAIARHGPEALDFSVAEVMESPAPACSPSTSLAHAMRMMTRRRVRHLLVQENGAVVGIVSMGDLVKGQIQNAELENRVLRDIAQAKMSAA